MRRFLLARAAPHPRIGLDWIGLDWIGLDWIRAKRGGGEGGRSASLQGYLGHLSCRSWEIFY